MRTPRRTVVRLLVAGLVAAALIPLLGIDPAILAVLLDLDFLAVTGLVGLTMLGADARVLASRITRSLPVLWIRVGVTLSRAHPGTLVSP